MSASPPKSSLRRIWILLLPPLALALGALYWLPTKSFMEMTAGSSGVFYRDTAGWHEAKDAPGIPEDLRISQGGDAWLKTSFKGGLSHWNGSRWIWYSGGDFHTQANYVWGGFAIGGKYVWGASKEGLLRFDGERWSLNKQALVSEDPVGTVAREDEAWVLDRNGNLTHCKLDDCSTSSIRGALPAVQWGETISFTRPELALTQNGRLWIVSGTVWWSDGARWQAAEGAWSKAQLVGDTGDRVLVQDGPELIAIAMSGSVAQRYRVSEIGIVLGATIADSKTVVAGTDALWEWDGERWNRIAALEGSKAYRRVASSPDGTLWVIAANPPSAIRRVVLIGVALAGMLFILWLTGQFLKFTVQRTASSRGEVEQVLPEILRTSAPRTPAGLPSGVGSRLLVSLVAAIGAVAGSWWLLSRFWPGTPAWVATALSILIAVLVGTALQYLWPVPGSPKRPGARELRRVILFLAWIFAFIYFPRHFFEPLAKWIPKDPTVAFLVFGGGALGILLLGVSIPPFAITWWTHLAARKGDYAKALRRAALLKNMSLFRTIYDGIRASILVSWARPKEAEEIVIQGLKVEEHKAAAGLHLDTLGDALLDQGRLTEATDMFERSITAYPGRGGSHSGLAEVLLLLGEPQRALEATEKALERESGRGWLMRRLNREVHARMWANRAWALAELGRQADAEQALRTALKEAGDKNKPALAGVHYRAGMMYGSLGYSMKARDEWAVAKQLDPEGRYGRKADDALQGVRV